MIAKTLADNGIPEVNLMSNTSLETALMKAETAMQMTAEAKRMGMLERYRIQFPETFQSIFRREFGDMPALTEEEYNELAHMFYKKYTRSLRRGHLIMFASVISFFASCMLMMIPELRAAYFSVPLFVSPFLGLYHAMDILDATPTYYLVEYERMMAQDGKLPCLKQ